LNNKVVFAPLRQRKRDIPELVDYLLKRSAQIYKRPVPPVNEEAMGKLLSHDYLQKNITELAEALERAFQIAENDRIESEHIFLGVALGNIGPGINLLRIKPLMAAIQKKIYPGYFQAAVTLAFVTNICLNLFGTKDHSQNWGTMISWSLGWPSFVFCVLFFGRLTCSVCPMSNIASFFQRFFHLAKPIPAFIKKNDYLIITFLFVFILWIEEITNMRQSPRATGILFLSIVSGAVITAVLLPRHSWRRHICPLGDMFGVCSMASPLELRSNAELCLNKCTTYSCYKGADNNPGCPLFQHVPFIDNNQDCKLCMNCVRSCPNGSVQLNLRPPAMEIWDLVRVRRSMTVFVAALLMIIFPLIIFNMLHESLTHSQWFLWFTVYYWLLKLH